MPQPRTSKGRNNNPAVRYREPVEVASISPEAALKAALTKESSTSANIRHTTNQLTEFEKRCADMIASGETLEPESIRILEISERYTKQRRQNEYPAKSEVATQSVVFIKAESNYSPQSVKRLLSDFNNDSEAVWNIVRGRLPEEVKTEEDMIDYAAGDLVPGK